MIESKVEMIEPSVNVLWQNLIALNGSLFKENEEKSQQLIEMKKKLLEEKEESSKLRSDAKQYQQDLMSKNQRIVQLTSKLKAVRQLTEDDCIETGHLIVEKMENGQVKPTSITHIGNEISRQRKISQFFQNGCMDTESKSSVKENCDSRLNRTECTFDGRDGQDSNDENLLIPLFEVRNSKDGVVCNECGRCFKNSLALKQHEIIHTVERPIACQKCPRAFVRSDHLKSHMRYCAIERNVSGSKKHLKESSSVSSSKKQLSDSHSASGSKKQLDGNSSDSGSKKQLNESHSVSGSGSGLFKCDICDAKFTQSYNVNRHKRNVHGHQ